MKFGLAFLAIPACVISTNAMAGPIDDATFTFEKPKIFASKFPVLGPLLMSLESF